MYYNFFALQDDEFEELARDILSQETDQELRIFGKGADQGIDIADCTDGRTVVAQCKNYIDTPYSKLIRVLGKEKEKVQKLNPKEYYLFINKDLSPKNITSIYELFHDWMASEKNIYTRSDCDAYISKSENQNISNKYPHLLNPNSLHALINSSTIIDNQDLLASSEDLSDLFVPTEQYRQAMALLENNQIVLISGAPGTGKTISSKMLATQFMLYGHYSLCYSDGEDLHHIKDALSPLPKQKEFIFIDDVFGQHYHDMNSSKENLLKQIIRRVNNSPNKRMLINTRMTILQEARQRCNFADGSSNGKEPFVMVNMSQITPLEKAEIFIRHLKCRDIDKNYIDAIKNKRAYLDIVRHPNYTPRIIDRCTQEKYVHETGADKYVPHILHTLNHADAIWDDEFKQRLSEPDRILLYTLYSLTSYSVSENALRQAANTRLNPSGTSYESVSIKDILQRLNESMIAITYKSNTRTVRAINPSVNDFLRSYLQQTPEECDKIIAHAAFMDQIERFSAYTDDRAYRDEKIIQLLDSFVSGKDAPGYADSSGSAAYVNAALLVLAKEKRKCIIGEMETHRFSKIAKDFMDAVLRGNIGFSDSGVRFKSSTGYSQKTSSFLPGSLKVLQNLNDDYAILNQWHGEKENIKNILYASEGLEVKSQLCSMLYPRALTLLDQHHINALNDAITEDLNAEIAFIQESAEISDYYSNSDVGQYDSLYPDDDDVWRITNKIADAVQQEIDDQVSSLPDELYSLLDTVDASYYEESVAEELARHEDADAMNAYSPAYSYTNSVINSQIDELFKNL